MPGCASFGPPSPEKAFAGRQEPRRSAYAISGDRKIATAESGDTNKPLVLFVHGSPGVWNDFALVMADADLARRALLVSVDRPGWGGSAEGGLEVSLPAQARALKAVLDAHAQNLPAIVVGHSYGAPVAARLAMDAPQHVGTLVIVAGSIDPDLERTTWFQAMGRWSGIRWMVPGMFKRADAEIIPLKKELEKMLPAWAGLRMSVTVIHGDSDALVPPENVDFALRALTNASLVVKRIPKQGHLIPWQRPGVIVDAIHAALDEATAGPDAPRITNFPPGKQTAHAHPTDGSAP